MDINDSTYLKSVFYFCVKTTNYFLECGEISSEKETYCMRLVCYHQKMSPQDNPEFLHADESSTKQHLRIVADIYR